jgi:hypothetical protein
MDGEARSIARLRRWYRNGNAGGIQAATPYSSGANTVDGVAGLAVRARSPAAVPRDIQRLEHDMSTTPRMTRNMDSVERWVRLALGLGFLAWIPLDGGDLRWFGLIGIYPLATALFGYCPVYRWLGIDKHAQDRR